MTTQYAQTALLAYLQGTHVPYRVQILALDGKGGFTSGGSWALPPVYPGRSSYYRVGLAWHSDGSLIIARRSGSSFTVGYQAEWWRLTVAPDLTVTQVAYFTAPSATGQVTDSRDIHYPAWPTGVFLDTHEGVWSMVDIDGGTITTWLPGLPHAGKAAWARTGAVDRYAIVDDYTVSVLDGSATVLGSYTFGYPSPEVQACGDGFLATCPGGYFVGVSEIAVWNPSTGWTVGDSLPPTEALVGRPIRTLSGDWVLAAHDGTSALWVYPLDPATGTLGPRVAFAPQGYAHGGWIDYHQHSGFGYLFSDAATPGTGIYAFGFTMANILAGAPVQSPMTIGVDLNDANLGATWCVRPWTPPPSIAPPLFQVQRSGGVDGHAYRAIQRTTRQSSLLQSGML